MGEKCIQDFGAETWGETDHLEDPGVDRIILRWIFRKWDVGGAWTGLIWLRIETGGGQL
jgi:hypothetical protein